MKKALEHLKKDKVLAGLIEKYSEDIARQYWSQSEGQDLFVDLIEIIVGQQLSMKAADSIFARVKKYFGGKITLEKIKESKEELLRQCGLSFSKVRYIKGLGKAVESGDLDTEALRELPDDEVLEELIKIKGIGPWSAEMFLMFSLRRRDVFSFGDLGLKTAISKHYKIKKDDLEAMKKLASQWSPYRTIAAKYLWRSLDNS